MSENREERTIGVCTRDGDHQCAVNGPCNGYPRGSMAAAMATKMDSQAVLEELRTRVRQAYRALGATEVLKLMCDEALATANEAEAQQDGARERYERNMRGALMAAKMRAHQIDREAGD